LAYTFDDKRSEAVNEAFLRMYNDGLIYRGHRVIHWSVKGQSTCSEDELEMVERTATLYTFTYSADFPIPISTTRPETNLATLRLRCTQKIVGMRNILAKSFRCGFVVWIYR